MGEWSRLTIRRASHMSYPFTPSFMRPLSSKATRTPSPRSKASSRGHVISQMPADPHLRLRYFESKHEQDTLFLLMAWPGVVDIWDQPPQIAYRDENGRLRHHTFDYLLTLSDGSRIAIAVKPESIVRSTHFRETLRLIRAGTPLHFAKEVVLITEHSYTPSAARNAQKLHDFRRTPDPEADHAIATLVAALEGQTTIAELVAAAGLGGRAFRAAFKAIYSGILRVLDEGDIRPMTRIVAGGSQ